MLRGARQGGHSVGSRNTSSNAAGPYGRAAQVHASVAINSGSSLGLIGTEVAEIRWWRRPTRSVR